MPRIEVIDYKNATGRLLDIYDEIIQKRGKLAEVHKIQSLRPESIVKHIDLYLEIMFSRSELSRANREMMAVVCSVANGCEYCRIHHSVALNHYWKDDKKINLLINDFRQAGLNKQQLALCHFARQLTIHPTGFDNDPTIAGLKTAGFSDPAILDATLVVAYFNFVNRIVLALGLEGSDEEVKDYKY